MSELLTQFKDFSATVDGRFSDLTLNVERALKRLDGIEAEWTRKDDREQKASGGFFADVLASDQFKSFAAGGFRGRCSVKLSTRSLIAEEGKTIITSATLGSSTPGILNSERLPGVFGPGVRRVRVRDAFIRVPSRQNSVDWVKENAFTNAASPVAETISKPESALTFVIDSVPARTLAHWIPIAKQAFDDGPEIAAYTSARLLQGLMKVLDYEIIAGDGTGQHLNGLSLEAAVYETARNVTGDTKLDKLNHAISQLEDADFMPNVAFVHPRDYRSIELVKEDVSGANTGAYLLGGPTVRQAEGASLWDLAIIRTTAITPGKFYVGDSSYAVVIDRQDPIVEISSEHADFWVKNLLAVRCECRVSFAATRGDAFVYGSF